MEEELFISAIEPQKKRKDRYNIYADGEFFASLGAHTVVSFGLRAGASVDADTLHSAALADNTQYAFDSAASMLAQRMHTRGELVQKLQARGICEQAVQAALDKLASYGYVDDLAYAREYVQSAVRAGRLGRRAVAYRLGENGLSRDVTEEAMALYTEEDERRAAAQQARLLLDRHIGADQRKQKQKVYAALMRHGFDHNIISALLSEDEP